MNIHQLVSHCISCKTESCKSGCPASCSPKDFIMACKQQKKSDIERAMYMIWSNNPFAGTCGIVCPKKFCMHSCTMDKIDYPCLIPNIQRYIIEKCIEYGIRPKIQCDSTLRKSDEKVAIFGGGPAGLTASIYLSNRYSVDIYETSDQLGGSCNRISKLPKYILEYDISNIIENISDKNIYFNIDHIPSDRISTYKYIVIAIGKDGRTNTESEYRIGDYKTGKIGTVVEAVADAKKIASALRYNDLITELHVVKSHYYVY